MSKDIPLKINELITQTVNESVQELMQQNQLKLQEMFQSLISNQASQNSQPVMIPGHQTPSKDCYPPSTHTELYIEPSAHSNRLYLLASNYYEAMLRVWSTNQTIYALSAQLYTYGANVAYEIHKQTLDFTNAQNDAWTAWSNFSSTLDTTIKLDIENWNGKDVLLPITIMFNDGMVVTGNIMSDLDGMVAIGGLPSGTHVYINLQGYYISTDNVVYKTAKPDIGVPIPTMVNVNQCYQPNPRLN